MPGEVATLCFHTRDAVARDDSRLTFEVPGDRLRTDAVRVALGSCEFPMVQWTIEEDWNRLYLNEGVRLDDHGATTLRLAQKKAAGGGGGGGSSRDDGEVRTLRLPARVNRVERPDGKTRPQHGPQRLDQPHTSH